MYDDDGRPKYRIDVGNAEVAYGAEYFGEQFHGDDQRERDEGRITWLEEQRDWSIDVFTKIDVYGSELSAADRLRRGFLLAETAHVPRHTSYIDLAR